MPSADYADKILLFSTTAAAAQCYIMLIDSPEGSISK